MKRLALAATGGLICLIAVPASAAPRTTEALSSTNLEANWQGATASGVNTSYFLDSFTGRGTCASTDAQSYCDATLVHVDPKIVTDGATTITFRIEDFGKAADDFDLRVYRSDAGGARLEYLGSPTGDIAKTSPLGDLDPRHTFMGDYETKVVTDIRAADYYLVEVVYFTVAESSYKGRATIANLPPQPEPEPAP